MFRGGSADRAYAMLVVAALIVQFAPVAWTFPISDLLTGKPLFWIDSAYHWYQMTIASQCARGSGIICYDPFFGAGYPAGVTYNWSAKFPALLARMRDASGVARPHKLFASPPPILAPLCVPIAARVMDMKIRVAAVATIAGFMLWWASVLHWYHTAGMVSFVMASYAALAYIAFVH